jgi:hypothetical protein
MIDLFHEKTPGSTHSDSESYLLRCNSFNKHGVKEFDYNLFLPLTNKNFNVRIY